MDWSEKSTKEGEGKEGGGQNEVRRNRVTKCSCLTVEDARLIVNHENLRHGAASLGTYPTV
jgi:hypothetical protein